MKKWKRLRHERDRSNVRSEEFAVLGALGVRRFRHRNPHVAPIDDCLMTPTTPNYVTV